MVDDMRSPRAPDPRRQAAHIISAFRFQLLETAIAWMNLAEDATLLVEVFEDFDVEAADGDMQLTQVKHSVGHRTLTLASKDASEALANYWATSREGQVSGISLVIHTNMPIGAERGVDLPGEATGIEYWQTAKDDTDLDPLKNLLLAVLPAGDLKTWLANNPDDHVVRTRLINRVNWKTSQPSGAPQNALLAELIAGRLAALNLPVGLAPVAAAAIVERVGAVASETDPALRRLKTADLHAFLYEVCRSGQPGHEASWTLASWTVPVEVITSPAYLAPRVTLVGTLSAALAETSALWIHGASGTGKSTLALQLARSSGQAWLVVELRGLTKASDILLRLDRAYTDITLGHDIRGVILDDIDSDVVAQHAGRIDRFISWIRQRDGCVIFTSARALSPAGLQSAGLSPASAKEAPYLTIEETTELISQTKAPLDQVEAWGLFVHISASGGHPQLVAAKVISLEHRAWPKAALVEDLSGGTSEAIQLTRAEARRRLLNDATEQGRALLKRLGCILFKFDRPSAIALAALDPKIDDAAASLDLLTGPWIEKVPTAPGFLRLSPLLAGLQEDLGDDAIQRVRESFLISTIKRGPIPYEALDTVFWTAFIAKQGWFFVKFFEKSMSFDEDKSEAIAAKLASIVYLRTDEPLLPDDPGTSHILRLLQIDIAAQNGEKQIFQGIAIAAMREARAEPNEELQNALSLMALFKILFAQGTKLDWGLRLAWILFFEVLANKDPDLINRSQGPAVQAMKAEFGDVADVSGFMLTIGASAIESPQELRALFGALDELETSLRDRRLLQLRSFFKGYGLHVQSAWVRAWSSGDIDVEAAISQYGEMTAMAARWNDADLVAECIVAQSVLWDELQNDRVAALKIVDVALAALPGHTELLRQKAKVLGHDRQYDQAKSILEQIRPQTDERSEIERMYAIKEQAVASANLGEIEVARGLFLEAAAAAESVEDEVVSIRAHGVALRAEAAMCSWRNGDAGRALRELAQIVDHLKHIDPGAHDAAKTLHRKIRWVIGWLHESTGGPTGLRRELSFGAIAALDAEYPDDEEDHGARYEDIKVLLTIIGLRKGIRNLFPDIDWPETTLGFHIFLAAAEFDLAVEDGDPKSLAQAILELVAAFDAALKEKNDPSKSNAEKAKTLTLENLDNPTVVAVLVHALSLAAFLGARDRADKQGYCQVLLTEMTNLLGSNTPALKRFDRILLGNMELEPSDHAGLIFSSAITPTSEVLLPSDIINRQLALLQCAIVCGCGTRTALRIHTRFAEEWSYVLEHQRFLLVQPMLHLPALESAIEYVRQGRPGALRNILQVAGRALNSQVPEEWLDLAERLGGKAAV